MISNYEFICTDKFKRDKKYLNPQILFQLKNALKLIKKNPYIQKNLEGRYHYLKKYYINSYRIIYEPMNSKISLLDIDHRNWVYRSYARNKLKKRIKRRRK